MRVRRGAHAARAGIREGLRRGHCAARPGAEAHRGRADERGGRVRAAGPGRLARRRRGGDHRPGLPARRPRRIRAAHLPRLHRRLGGDNPLGEVQGLAGDRRGHPAPPAAHRRPRGQLRPGLQGQPAAAHRGRRGGAARRPGGRDDRLRGHRPRAPPGGGQGDRVGRRGLRHDRAGDRAAGGAGGDGGHRPARLGAGRRPDVGPPRRDRPAGGPGAAAGPRLPGKPGPLRPGNQFHGRSRRPRLPQPQLAVRRAHAARAGGGHVPARPRDRARREARLMAGPQTAAQRAWPTVLVLEDGTTFCGTGFGARGEAFGEIVFNTGMTGYQETLTDPSYCRQIVAMTAPHIGNTGVNDDDPESRRIWVSGYVVREPSPTTSSWRARRSLDEELAAQGVPGIAITGTRALTRRLRDRGVMRAAISATAPDPGELLRRVLASPRMTGADLAREVSTAEPYQVHPPRAVNVRYRVAAVDLGIKAATPAAMAARGCLVQVLPATATAAEILGTAPDGVFFSNGPGDPAAAGYAVAATRGVLTAGVPVFGICLGSQILSRAVGPVSLAPFDTPFGRAQVSHVNLNDGVVEGIRLLDAGAFGVQYHPEAAPGPHDAAGEFDAFCALMERPRRAPA